MDVLSHKSVGELGALHIPIHVKEILETALNFKQRFNYWFTYICRMYFTRNTNELLINNIFTYLCLNELKTLKMVIKKNVEKSKYPY